MHLFFCDAAHLSYCLVEFLKLVIVSIGVCLNDSIFLLPDVFDALPEESIPLPGFAEGESSESLDGNDVADEESAPSTTVALSSGELQECSEKIIDDMQERLRLSFSL